MLSGTLQYCTVMYYAVLFCINEYHIVLWREMSIGNTRMRNTTDSGLATGQELEAATSAGLAALRTGEPKGAAQRPSSCLPHARESS